MLIIIFTTYPRETEFFFFFNFDRILLGLRGWDTNKNTLMLKLNEINLIVSFKQSLSFIMEILSYLYISISIRPYVVKRINVGSMLI